MLARAQAEWVGQALSRLHPALAVEYRWIESEGDQRTEGPLADVGGKGLFTGAIEQAVLDGKADLAVHSLKDLPAGAMTGGLVIAAVPGRAEVWDCLVGVGVTSIEGLPQGATVGTGSPRRAAQLRHLRPDLRIVPLRGNIETRVRKVVTERQFAATLLAAAGLQRAGLAEHTGHPIDPSVILPAAGQGALAIQCRTDDHVTLTRCLPLNDSAASAAVNAERQVVAALEGDCHAAMAVLAEPVEEGSSIGLRLRARVLSTDGQECIEVDQRAPIKQVGRLVQHVIEQMQQRGAKAILAGRSPQRAGA